MEQQAQALLYRIQLGDMSARYYLDAVTQQVELQLLPIGCEPFAWSCKRQTVDSLVQLKLVGDAYTGYYAGGVTLRDSQSVRNLRYNRQNVIEKSGESIEVITYLQDDRGYEVEHHLLWYAQALTISCYTVFSNNSGHSVCLELLESVSLGGISPYLAGSGSDCLRLHRVRGVWSMEGRPESTKFEELQLEPSWGMQAIRCERFGQAGSMPANRFFPWAVIEDTKNHVFWGIQIAHNASWQIEVFCKNDGISLSGGLADREFGLWEKAVLPGESFKTPSAILTVCQGGTIDDAGQRLASAAERQVKTLPQTEQELGVVFNEYCSTWGNPSEDNINAMLRVLKDKKIDYFVIDSGWFKQDGKLWENSVGDYSVSKTQFPHGLASICQQIRNDGMIPGIWFEIECVSREADAYQMEEHLLHRDGAVLTTAQRRFWDMTDPWVWNLLSERIIQLLKTAGFGYLKIDYNESIGPCCDGAESPGEGLRKNMAAAFAFMNKLQDEIPNLIVENCASGGHRLEPMLLQATAMSSFSDAHECPEIPVIAANLHRVMLPRQSLVWAVVRKTDSDQRLYYTLSAAFLGRMCLSGDITELTNSQWQIVDHALCLYRRLVPLIRSGHSYWYGTTPNCYRRLTGWQGILRAQSDGDAYVVIHTFADSAHEEIRIPLKTGKQASIAEVFAPQSNRFRIEHNQLICSMDSDWTGAVVSLHIKR